MSFTLKQVGLSIALLAALLVGSASACACSHHQETTKSTETSCHGVDHETIEKVEVPAGGTTFDTDCSCFVDQPSPVIVSKSESKKSKTSNNVSDVGDPVSYLKFISNATLRSPLPELARQFSKSAILESLLPARAPPRL